MKKRVLAALCCMTMAVSGFAGCGGTSTETTADAVTEVEKEENTEAAEKEESVGGDIRIALITMDSIDQHWLNLKAGAEEEAKVKGVTLDFNAPNTKDDAQQIECVNNAVANGYDAIMVAANGPDSISGAINDAIAAGVKVVYVDSPANVEAVATFSTDNVAAGKMAGETLITALKEKGVTSGDIGVINVNQATQSCVDRENGFRSAFEGTEFNLLETQYCEGDAAKAQEEAQNYITQGVVGLFGCNEGSTTGVGNAIKAAGSDAYLGIGFDASDSIKSLIKDGHLVATMSQNPEQMGKLGVAACIEAVNGSGQNGAVVDTGVVVITKDNVE